MNRDSFLKCSKVPRNCKEYKTTPSHFIEISLSVNADH